ncbi:Ubiquitin Carboxyl-Terminal Hydrolase 43, partial [Manis pentadactyla]
IQPEASKTSENLPSPSAQLSLGQSFVQSHFQAQYRSSLTCPHCLKQSNTFDPFLCVSLPIPLRQTRFLSITLVFLSKSQRFLQFGLAVPILSTVAALRRMVAEEGGIAVDEKFLQWRSIEKDLEKIEKCGLQRSFSDEEDLNTVAEGNDVYAFQVPPPSGQEMLSACPAGLAVSLRFAVRGGQRSCLPVRSENAVLILFCNLVGSGQQASMFGPPFLIREDRAISWAQLQQCILSKVRYLMKSEAPVQNPGSLFAIRVVGLSLACSYLSPQDSQPLCHWAVDRALHLRRPEAPHTSNWPWSGIAVPRSGFFNPQSFLTTIMQSMVRKNEWPLDQMALQCDVTKKNREEVRSPPREGAYIHGLFMEGAHWDTQAGIITEVKLKDLMPPMPVMFIKAIPADKQDCRSVYPCPVYKTCLRGPTYVWTFNLKMKENPSKWVLAGVALLLQI